ncbi:MAG: ABC transporter substrate-binding protein [Lachnospiraceae bacterium]|nr:ABC transporter substrate-binding protein [Lachnospiraceae bacterium]
MKHRILPLILCFLLLMCTFAAACGSSSDDTDETTTVSSDSEGGDATADSDSENTTDNSDITTDDISGENATNDSSSGISDETGNSTDDDSNATSATVRIGALKGPTTMGISPMIVSEPAVTSSNSYEATMVTAADELMTLVLQEEVDIALLPANVAATLYNKTDGEITVIDINTLGVLYVVTGDDSVTSLEDLAGRTIYLTGKGTTPDYALQYVLSQAGILDEVTLEYKSESSEVAALLASDSTLIGLLPQPYVTVALANNEDLSIALSLDEEWTNVSTDGSRLVTGVTIVRNSFLEEYPDAVAQFLTDHAACAALAAEDPDQIAEYVVELGIIEKEAVAKKAVPYCSISYYDGEEMKEMLSGYLQVLYDLNTSAVGGSMPGDDFYYIP